MSSPDISWIELDVPAAALGPESPLPAFAGLQRLPSLERASQLPSDMRERIAYGRLDSPLPYAVQNGYRRALDAPPPTALKMSNGRLSAVVLPQFGGRVWSLRDDLDGTDLIFESPQLSFANLALTDAWFAGGIEWNLGSTGHAATTSRPVFAGHVETERGSVLRLWDWERTRDLVFQIDLCLPSGSPLLLASIRVRNPDPEPKPLYWWTLAAVGEHPGVRVVAPADRAWRSSKRDLYTGVNMPFPTAAVDVSYPLGAPQSVDYFFQINDGQRPWIAAVQADGAGVVHTSTDRLRGRNMFCWGTGNGGEHWQQWLCGPRVRYMEIQCGLATTQLEHRQLAGGAEISWTEVFGSLAGDAARLHGSWSGARREVEQQVENLVGTVGLSAWHDWWRSSVADQPPAALLVSGSAAGRAELTIRGQPADLLPGTPFGDTADRSFDELIKLATGGEIDHDRAGEQTLIPPITKRWSAAFENAAGGWWGELMIAIRAHAARDFSAAEAAYARSEQLKPTAWAARGLALLAFEWDDVVETIDRYATAARLAPDCLPLLIEASDRLIVVGAPREALDLLAEETTWRAHGRLTLNRIRALVAVGDHEAARQIMEEGFEIPDLREGEVLNELWQQLFPGRPLPYHYDFRISPHGH